MDTTYFGHTFGALVLMDSVSKQVLSVDIVAYETNQLYYQAVKKLKDNNMIIQSIICDGRKGLPQLFADSCATVPVSSSSNGYSIPEQ